MYTFLISFILFLAVLLVLVILAQNSKGGGLTSQFGGSSASNIIGVKKTGDLLEKLTWGLSIAVMVLSLLSATTFITPGNQGTGNELLDRAGEQAPINVNPNPGLELNTDETPADTTK